MQGKLSPHIGIDLMGGDTSPEMLFQTVLKLHAEPENRAEFTIFATPEVLSKLSIPSSIKVIETSDVVSMDDDPLVALRRKKNSSFGLGMPLLQKKTLDAFVSAGNTGALIASAKMTLSTLSGIARPALLTLLPTRDKEVAVLDIGANVTYKGDHLLQFASMGIAYQKSRGITHPTVGLLNIGSEEKKGTPELREAYKKLQSLNKDTTTFIGNVEGRDVFKGDIDVLVTDGFTGNVFLKTAEGIAAVILDQLEENASEQCSPHLKAVLDVMRQRLHYAEYPGAILCGVDGIVVKCHGDSNPDTFGHGIRGAIRLVENQFLTRIKTQLALETDKFSLSSLLRGKN
jgi:glycerol-3-phosphate acyltransferase PlsX